MQVDKYLQRLKDRRKSYSLLFTLRTSWICRNFLLHMVPHRTNYGMLSPIFCHRYLMKLEKVLISISTVQNFVIQFYRRIFHIGFYFSPVHSWFYFIPDTLVLMIYRLIISFFLFFFHFLHNL